MDPDKRPSPEARETGARETSDTDATDTGDSGDSGDSDDDTGSGTGPWIPDGVCGRWMPADAVGATWRYSVQDADAGDGGWWIDAEAIGEEAGVWVVQEAEYDDRWTAPVSEVLWVCDAGDVYLLGARTWRDTTACGDDELDGALFTYDPPLLRVPAEPVVGEEWSWSSVLTTSWTRLDDTCARVDEVHDSTTSEGCARVVATGTAAWDGATIDSVDVAMGDCEAAGEWITYGADIGVLETHWADASWSRWDTLVDFAVP